MEGRCAKPYGIKQEEPGIKSEYGGELPFPVAKLTSSSTSKRRRAVQKKVVSIPIGDVHGSRLKGDGAPPSDSWAWRKYGQKPIKGSPYPRGYYRCSSSKGCPARKQVERSRVDPAMLVVTYACDHNHAGPASKNHNTTTKTKPISPKQQEEQQEVPTPIFTTESEDKFSDLTHEYLLRTDDFTWFSDVAMPESPIISAGNSAQDTDVAMIFPMGEEDESLFADLGELPECSVVFRRGCMEQEERRRCTLGAG